MPARPALQLVTVPPGLVLPFGMRLPVKGARVPPYPNETKFSEAAQKRLREEWGGQGVKTHGGPAAVAGTPDLLFCVGGRFLACELKQPGNKPTPRQYSRLRAYEAAGAVAGWVTTMPALDELVLRCAEPAGAWCNPQLVRADPDASGDGPVVLYAGS